MGKIEVVRDRSYRMHEASNINQDIKIKEGEIYSVYAKIRIKNFDYYVVSDDVTIGMPFLIHVGDARELPNTSAEDFKILNIFN